MQARQRTRTGWFFMVTGFLACPCHLVITLPLAVTLLGGTALGGWIATHQGAIALGATLYFVGALALGATLLLARTGQDAVDPEGVDAETSDAALRQMTASPCCPPSTLSSSRAAGSHEETT